MRAGERSENGTGGERARALFTKSDHAVIERKGGREATHGGCCISPPSSSSP